MRSVSSEADIEEQEGKEERKIIDRNGKINICNNARPGYRRHKVVFSFLGLRPHLDAVIDPWSLEDSSPAELESPSFFEG